MLTWWGGLTGRGSGEVGAAVNTGFLSKGRR